MKKLILIFLSLFLTTASLLFAMRGVGMDIQTSVSINAAPSTVWEYLVDNKKIQSWNPDIISDEPLDDLGLAPGAKGRIMMKEGKSVNEYISELVEVTSSRKLVLTLRGKNLGTSPMTVKYELLENGDATTVEYSASWSPQELLLKIMAPIIKIAASKNVNNSMASLKKTIEKP